VLFRSVVISHPNTDHFNALPDCARRLGVREVIVGQAFLDAAEASDAVRAFLDALEAQGVRVRTIGADESLALGNISFEVLSPRSGEAYSRENNNSIVLRAMIPTNQDPIPLVLTGDIEREAIGDILDAHPDLRAMISEVPHHGSARPAAMGFIEALDPTIALQSTGLSRLDDERWDDVRIGRDWYVTARDGAISVIVKKDGTVRTETFVRD